MVGELVEPLHEDLANLRSVPNQIILFNDFDVFQCHSGCDRMATAGESMPQGAERMTLVCDALIELIVDQNRRDWLVGRGQLLGKYYHIRFYTEGLAAEHIAGAAETTDHFVRDDENVILSAHGLNFFPIGPWRHNHSAGAHERLAIEGGDCFGAFANDKVFQL
ncbi:hypothetical protein D3C76_1208390 [compost metagenome]